MLTKKQHELLTFIAARLRETGFSPSFEEMKAIPFCSFRLFQLLFLLHFQWPKNVSFVLRM